MAGKPKIMSQIKQLIRLKQLGYSIKSIAKTLKISKNTVKTYLYRVESCQTDIETLLGLDDPVLESKLLAGSPSYKTDPRYEYIKGQLSKYHAELQKTGVTRLLLWQEYKRAHPSGYGYTQFCYHLNQHQLALKPSMVLHHQPGEKLFIDFAGKKLSYINIETGEIIECQVFVACLPYSDYGFAMAVHTQSLPDFIYALGCCLKALGGVPATLVPDNLKSAVIKADRYEPDINRAMEDFANHYHTTVTPARAARPQDKALVENHVRLVYSRVYAQIRDRQFFDISSLNKEIAQRMLNHNQTRMQQKNYCREEKFLSDEKPKLKPLPEQDFEIKHYKTLKVAKNNHVFLSNEKHYYSVPYQYTGCKVTVVYTRWLVQIYIDGKKVASHIRSKKFGYTTVETHLCSTHKHYLDRSPEYYCNRAKKCSDEFYNLICEVFKQDKYPEQLYRTCDGLFNLQRKTKQQEFNNACKTALQYQNYSYMFISNIIKNRMPPPDQKQLELEFQIPKHKNTRGAAYYQ